MSKKNRTRLIILGVFLAMTGISGLTEDFLLALFLIALGIWLTRYAIKKEVIIKESSPTQSSPYVTKSPPPKDHDYVRARKLVDDVTVLDFETTGLDPRQDEIIQVGAVKYRNGVEIERFSTYIRPGNPIPRRITELTGITNRDVKKAPRIEEVIGDLHSFLESETIVAHNAPFDMKFLLSNLKRHKIPHEKFKVIDTLWLARRLIDTDNHKLPTLKNYLGIEANSHDALEDCLVTGKLYYHCKELSGY